MNRVLVVVSMLLAMPAGLFAEVVYSENYDSMALGTPAGWVFIQPGEAVVSNTVASSGTQSLGLVNYTPEGNIGYAFCPIAPITGTDFQQKFTITLDNPSSSWTNFFVGASSMATGTNLTMFNVGTRSNAGNNWFYSEAGQACGVTNAHLPLGTWIGVTADYHWDATSGIYDKVSVLLNFANKEWLYPIGKPGGMYYYQDYVNNLSSAGVDTIDSIYFGSAGTAGAKVYIDDMSVVTTPEPATMALLGLGGMAMLRRRCAK